MRQEQIADIIYTHVSSMGEVSGIEDAADAILAEMPNMKAVCDQLAKVSMERTKAIARIKELEETLTTK
jgi:3-deoxy-D-manno-octulosonic-acid transferase